MASPERMCPLSNWTERFSRASLAAAEFSVREAAIRTQINLRGNASDLAFAAAVASALGFGLPNAANTWSGTAERCALWLGPDENLIVDAVAEEAELYAALSEALSGTHFSIVDLSASRSVIEISGTYARLVLAKGCSLDLHARSFHAPCVAQSLLAKAQVILQVVEDRPVFRLLVRNSFAAYLAEWLLDAATECAAARGVDSARFASQLG